MKRLKLAIVATALLAAAILAPVQNSEAWVAVGHYGGGYRYGGVHVGYSSVHVGSYYHPYNCYAGVGAAAVAGFAVGAALHPAPIVVAPTPAVIVAPQPIYAQSIAQPMVGGSVSFLPMGATSMVVNGTQYYQAGGTWYRPYFGSNGIYYTVVPTP